MSDSTPQDFNTQCHFTMQLFSCGHKAWLRCPKINHVLPCQVPKPAHKIRCNNMTKGHPKEERVVGLCPKCLNPEALATNIEQKPGLQLDEKLKMVEAVQKRTRELQRARAGVVNGEMVVPRGEQAVDEVVAKAVVEDVEREDPAFFGEWENVQKPSSDPPQDQPIAEPSSSADQNPQEQTEDQEILATGEPLTDSDEEYDRATWENEKRLWMSFPSIENGKAPASKPGFLGRLFGRGSANKKAIEAEKRKEKEWKEAWEEVELEEEGE